MLAKIQKTLVIVSISTVGLVMAMLIAAVFKAPVFDKDKILLPIMLSLAVIAAGCFFANNALDMFEDKKPLSISCLVLLAFSAILGFIHFWSKFSLSEGFGKFTGIVVITSVLFVIIVTTYGALDKHFFVLQMITYVLVGLIDVVLIMTILGADLFHGAFTTIFVVTCIAAVALLLTTNILGKRLGKIVEAGFIKVNKAEYEALKQRVEELEKENAELKSRQ
ncbi:MAG: bZIP transcription factor [Bacilli bacterium]|nr:bZIP transcription factor [Bacilli bacterium]MBO7536458.1 bZIP transcription factor [Bacilli bacterium]MBP5550553.1 bZIP transcription factor [Bacilli bacterium]